MGMRVSLAAALVLPTTIASAEHAISLDAEPPAAPQAATSSLKSAPPSATAERAPGAANVKVAFPSKMGVSLVETGRREVCDTFDFGDGDVRTECRAAAGPARERRLARDLHHAVWQSNPLLIP